MALAVCLVFDGPTERRLRALWEQLEQRGVHTLASHTHGRHQPHLSYAVLREWDLERVRAAVDALPTAGRSRCRATEAWCSRAAARRSRRP
jgi:hypothetical protein